MDMKVFNLSHQVLVNADGEFVREIQLFKLGKFKHWSGKEFTVDEKFLDEMIANFEAAKVEAKDKHHIVPIDYNHASLADGEVAKAGGWISELTKKEDGLYATVEYTKNAAQMVKDKEFRFISPEFGTGVVDEFGEEVLGPVLNAAALTNRPFLRGMAPLSLKTRQTNEEKIMKDKLTKTFSLSQGVSEDAIVSHAEKVILSLSEARTALGLKEGDNVAEAVKVLLSDRAVLKTSLTEVSETLSKFKAETATKAAVEKVELALKTGKILPKAKDKWLKLAQENPETYDSLVEELAPQVELEPRGAGGANAPEKGDFHAAVIKLSAEKNISYTDAMKEIQVTNPELANAYINKTGQHSHIQ